jgi:hypothetical protein
VDEDRICYKPIRHPSGCRLSAEARLEVLGVTMALLAVATLLFHFFFQPASQSSVRMRWVISPPEGTQFLATGDAPAPVAISPDGRRIAFVAGAPGKSQLYVS